jgi:hypothetical protein
MVCVLVPFVVFVIETIWELERAKRDENTSVDEDRWVGKGMFKSGIWRAFVIFLPRYIF